MADTHKTHILCLYMMMMICPTSQCIYRTLKPFKCCLIISLSYLLISRHVHFSPQDAIFRQMIKRLQNVKSSQNLMSPPSTPKPSQTPRSKKRQLEFTPNHDAEYDADSSASTDNADPPENTTTDLDSDDSTGKLRSCLC